MTGKISTVKRRREIYNRYVAGDPIPKIAEEFGLSAHTILTAVSKLRRHEEAVLGKIAGEMKLRLIQQHEYGAAEARHAWEKSKQLLERVESHSNATDKEHLEFTEFRERKTHGDAAYLREYRHSLQAIADLCGLNAPKTQITANVTAQQIEIRETIVTTREDLARARELQAQKNALDVGISLPATPLPGGLSHAIADAPCERGAGQVYGEVYALREQRGGGTEECTTEAASGGLLQPVADGQDE